mgnify:CR=1 FL=1
MDWLSAHVGPDEDVQLRSLTNDQTILLLAGPKSRDVLNEVLQPHHSYHRHGTWVPKGAPKCSGCNRRVTEKSTIYSVTALVSTYNNGPNLNPSNFDLEKCLHSVNP